MFRISKNLFYFAAINTEKIDCLFASIENKVRLREKSLYVGFLAAAILLMNIAGLRVYAQQGLKYEVLGLQQGLSQSSALTMVQDNFGFIWVGTQDGLNRYDGYGFRVFRHSRKDSTSIIDNHISSLHLDKENLLWVGTDKTGVSCFNPATQTFTNFYPDKSLSDALSSGSINHITNDKEDNIWFGTDHGLSMFNKKTRRFTNFTSEKDNPNSIISNFVSKVLYDEAGYIWACTGRGVSIYDLKKKKFDTLTFSADVTSRSVFAAYKDNFNVIWLGMENGQLVRFDETTRKAVATEFKAASAIRNIIEDNKGYLWLGTASSEIIKYNLSDKKVEVYNPELQNGIACGVIFSMLVDKSGVFWFGTETEGVLKYDNQQERFKTYAINPYSSSSKANIIWSVFKDREGTLWAGSEDGIFKLPKGKNQFERYLPERLDLRRTSNYAGFFDFGDPDGFAVGLGGGLLWRINYNGKDFERPYDTLSLLRVTTAAAYKDKRENVWFATSHLLARGRYNPEKRAYDFRYFHPKRRTEKFRYPAVRSTSVFEDIDGVLWFSSDSGMIAAIRNAEDEIEEFKFYPSVEADPTTLSHNYIFHSAISSDGRTIWVATANGLNKFDAKTRKAVRLGEKYEQANYPIYSVLLDESDNLWMSSNVGIIKFDPKKENFTVFTIRDGLQSNEFNQYSFYKAPDGEMFFGGVKGFNSFYPKDIKPNPFKPEVVITDFKIFNQHIYPNAEDSPLTKDISLTDEIVLTHEQYIFSFDFVALSYRLSEKNQYAFIMEGFEKEWNYVGDRRYANYSNLPPGDYVFRVKAANNDGVWNEDGKSIKIRIKPPFWKTWWFITFSVVVFFGSIYGIYRQRVRSINAQKLKLQKLVDQRTAEVVEKNLFLEKQKNELERSYENVRIIGEIGQKVTATLDVDKIIDTVYKNVNMLMDASAFGIGILSEDKKRIEFHGFIEEGNKLPDDYDSIDNNDCLSVWCYKNRKEVLINDFDAEHINYIDNAIKVNVGKKPESVIYVPLLLENEVVGVLTVQSFTKFAYSSNNVTLLQTLASYISIAIDNANAYTRLDQAKEQLAAKTTALLDSIRYGETIQKAILPNSQRFYAYFTDYFVIYKPKDVVSGDFYWAVEDSNQLFLAVVDCTGHGVPGAFMSMIGNTLLSDIVNQRNVHEPCNILEELHNAVRIALHQEDMQNSDGMDVCLVRITTEGEDKMRIVFSGAKRPLFYVRDGYLFEEKGFKKSIGGRQKEIERKYTQKEIVLKRGDLIYLSTDGYVDQNNPERIKFGTLKFKNVIRRICTYSMQEQENVLLEEMQAHMNGAEQRDDIALIGIRL